MSYVSNAILTFRYADAITRRKLADHQWAEINAHTVGGPKVWEADTFVRTYNHTPSKVIVDEARSCMNYCEGAVLVVHEEGHMDDEVHVWVGSRLEELS